MSEQLFGYYNETLVNEGLLDISVWVDKDNNEFVISNVSEYMIKNPEYKFVGMVVKRVKTLKHKNITKYESNILIY